MRALKSTEVGSRKGSTGAIDDGNSYFLIRRNSALSNSLPRFSFFFYLLLSVPEQVLGFWALGFTNFPFLLLLPSLHDTTVRLAGSRFTTDRQDGGELESSVAVSVA